MPAIVLWKEDQGMPQTHFCNTYSFHIRMDLQVWISVSSLITTFLMGHFFVLQPVSPGSWLAAPLLLRPVQPPNRGAAKVPPQGPLRDRRQPRGSEGSVWRPPCSTGMSQTETDLSCHSRQFFLKRANVIFVCLTCIIIFCHYSISGNTQTEAVHLPAPFSCPAAS